MWAPSPCAVVVEQIGAAWFGFEDGAENLEFRPTNWNLEKQA